MPRGSKTCPNPNCQHPNGPRAYQCSKCGESFSFKKESTAKKAAIAVKVKKRKAILLQVDWRELKPNDHILVKGGPYYFDKAKMLKKSMGYKGHYVVVDIKPNGILAYSGRREGYAFIYMGKPEKSPDGIINRRPHKLRLMKKKE